MTIISRGVEISIAGGGGEMVRGALSLSFIFTVFFLLFFYFFFFISNRYYV